MGTTYLTWLADELRAVGLNVTEVSGWQARARGSGGFDGNKPWIVMLHHTASQQPSKNDVNYMCYGSDVRPVANLYIGRAGDVWVMAAGATNTNGKGRARSTSRGTIPENQMNLYAVGVEMGNNGVGEVWPQTQIDAMFDVTICLLDKLGLQDHDVGLHEWYSPGRKIDPATCNVAGPWVPNAWTGNNSGTWDLDDVWAEVTARRHGNGGYTPIPPPNLSKGTPMVTGLWKGPNDPAVFAVTSERTKVWCYPDTVDEHQALLRLEGTDDSIRVQTSSQMFRAMGPVVGPRPGTVDEYGWR